MLKIFAATVNELLLLKRDRAGLLVLFVMPALLVVVITLVQENVMQLTGQKKTRVLLLDLEGGMLGNSLRESLAGEAVAIVDLDKTRHDGTTLRRLVTSGEYQVGLLIKPDTSNHLRAKVQQLFQDLEQPDVLNELNSPSVSLYFDPGVMPGFRLAIKTQLQAALKTIVLEIKIAHLAKELEIVLESLGVTKQRTEQLSAVLANRLTQPVIEIAEGKMSTAEKAIDYNPVQQNVPAWAIFGMFFTGIPIAGSILQERMSGIWVRLGSLPVARLQLFCGKVFAYILVCFNQFLVVAIIGYFLFPRIGLPTFTLSSNYPAILVIICFIALAASGFGILLGMLCSSYEQASAAGACSVVIAAAIGGIMVPVYAMPDAMQVVSTFSPLNWGLNAFNDLLVRGYSPVKITDDLGRLLLFFVISVFCAWRLSFKRI